VIPRTWLAVALAFTTVAPSQPPSSATARLTARDVLVTDVTVSRNGERLRLTMRLLDASDVEITAPRLTQRARRIRLQGTVIIDCGRMSAALFEVLEFQLTAPPLTIPIPVPSAHLDNLVLEDTTVQASTATTEGLHLSTYS
jgi:hypothetical protein